MALSDKHTVRLVCCEPRAALRLVEIQPPLIPGGSKEEFYTTSRGVRFIKVISAQNVVTWYMEVRP